MGVIQFGHSRTRTDDAAISQWFPSFFPWSGVDGDRLVKVVSQQISNHAFEHIGTETVRDTLKCFFQRFQSFLSSRSDWLCDNLEQALRKDIRGSQRSGLKESRQQFLILGCLAGITSSNRLAEVLIRFLSEQIFKLLEQEEPRHLREWGLALHKMCGLGYEPTLLQLASHLARPGPAKGFGWSLPSYYDPREELVRRAIADSQRVWAADHYRGRHGHRGLEPRRWSRARSAPASPHHQHHVAVGFHLPRMLQAGPTSSRYYDDMDDWEDSEDYDDVGVVRVQQHLQAAEVDELERRVRRLELSRY